MNKNDLLKEYYFRVSDLWKQFCEEHHILFDLTCDEYSLLLNSELGSLEVKIIEKENCIKRIKKLENNRIKIIKEINNQFPELALDSVKSLILLMNQFDLESKEKFLFRFNALLIDLIEKIQAQNKRNQLFINKALTTLKQIRLEHSGKKMFNSYSKNGSSTTSTV